MGAVFRATDSKLKRQVAIKVLPDEFSRDPERISRFQREAEALAALNHHSIGAIYDFQELDGSRFLILELVEGDTLADVLHKRGALPVNEALDIRRFFRWPPVSHEHDSGRNASANHSNSELETKSREVMRRPVLLTDDDPAAILTVVFPHTKKLAQRRTEDL